MVDAITSKDVEDELRRQLAIFFRKRIDGRMKKILGNGKLFGEFWGGKDRRVVMRDIVFQKIPDGGMRMREIDVAAPDPVVSVFSTVGDQAGGLRIVDHHKFGVEGEALGVFFVVGPEDFKVARLWMIGSAVQRVVEGFGDLEEIFAAGHDFPADVDAKFFR